MCIIYTLGAIITMLAAFRGFNVQYLNNPSFSTNIHLFSSSLFECY